MDPPMYPHRDRRFDSIGAHSIGAHLLQSNWGNASLDLSPTASFQRSSRQTGTRSDSGLDFDFVGTPKQTQQQYTHPNVGLYVASADSPWAPMVQSPQQPVYFNEQSTYSPGPESNRSYHSVPFTGDSAYHSGGTTQSTNFNELSADGHPGMEMDGKKAIQHTSKLASPKKPARSRPVSQISQEQAQFPCNFPDAGKDCDKVFQCKSAFEYEYRCFKQFQLITLPSKHMRMHVKPYRCDVPGCTRTGGFTTKNDLSRHKKSIHMGGIDPTSKTGSYRCTGKNCKNPKKVWPRLDNFKSHLEKMHNGEDTKAIIKSSLMTPVASVLDSHSANGGVSDSVNPLDLQTHPPNQFPVSSLPITPEIRLNGSPSFRNQLIDPTRLSPTSASSYQQRGRPRHTSTSPNVRPHTPIPAIIDTLSPLETLANVSVSQTSAKDVGAQSNDAAGLGNVNQEQSGLSGVQKTIDPSELQEMINLFNHFKPLLPVLKSIKDSSSIVSSPAGSRQNSASQPSTCEIDEERSDTFRLLNNLKAYLHPSQSNMSDGSSLGTSPNNNHSEGDGSWIYCDKPNCKKRVKRPCEMKKHLKRHTKPYGCTFGCCHKRFGSKNDWKRHENSQHFQIELWKCQEPSNGSNDTAICGKACYKEGRFRFHLEKDHNLTTEQISTKIEKCHVGRNNQTRFWCGFCVQVIELTNESGVAAWDERFSHIDTHFKEPRNVEDWYDDQKHVPKGTLGRNNEKKSTKLREDTHNDSSTNSPASGPSSTSTFPLSEPQSINLNKRNSDSMDDIEYTSPKRVHTDNELWICCHCHIGTQTVAIADGCNQDDCAHYRCDNCQIVEARTL